MIDKGPALKSCKNKSHIFKKTKNCAQIDHAQILPVV